MAASGALIINICLSFSATETGDGLEKDATHSALSSSCRLATQASKIAIIGTHVGPSIGLLTSWCRAKRLTGFLHKNPVSTLTRHQIFRNTKSEWFLLAAVDRCLLLSLKRTLQCLMLPNGLSALLQVKPAKSLRRQALSVALLVVKHLHKAWPVADRRMLSVQISIVDCSRPMPSSLLCKLLQ